MKSLARGTIMALGLTALAASPAAARDKATFGQGARYVAMGSSFASGSGVAPYDPAAPARCQRSTQNYAHQLAAKRNLALVDVTCGGATTAHILGAWNELPPQVEALTADTALVTITIGGNDIGYIGGLIAGSCGGDPNSAAVAQPLCQMIAAGRRGGAAMLTATEAGWTKVGEALADIVREIRRRAPRARIVFVDYLTVLPDGALCSQTPLSFEAARGGRATAARLAALTASVARRNGAEVLPVSRLSRGRHDACAAAPWMAGFIPPDASRGFVPYHPNLAGMTAVAEALDRSLGR
ncbi:SGNH/GDSL hydrolase family protein [Novosphingobium sp. PS1R-30]|uniref:SGNH/GDSL hydrolase family protein n=1 Tax=Novosphingobium anseongense TaxID=3133436 RepID=A0ABU8S1K2_9SPHN